MDEEIQLPPFADMYFFNHNIVVSEIEKQGRYLYEKTNVGLFRISKSGIISRFNAEEGQWISVVTKQNYTAARQIRLDLWRR